MTSARFVAYYRVSTARQGQSGLGLDAQQAACESFVQSRNGQIIEAFTEVESGKKNDRPKLQRALHLAKVTGSTLLIAKLDRLSRNAAFLLALRDSGVAFVAADMPDANSLTVGLLAIIAQHEREAISARTKAALAAAKARGQKLGSPNSAGFVRAADAGRKAGSKALAEKAAERSMLYAPIIDDVKAAGISTLSGIAAELNKRGIKTARGGLWYATSVKNVIDRLAA